MEDEGEWKEQISSKKRHNLKKKEQNKVWDEIKKECPHIITPQRAKKLQLALNIDNLAYHFGTEEWVNHQKDGWVYVKTFKGAGDSYILQQGEMLLPIVNNYVGDYALFRRIELNV